MLLPTHRMNFTQRPLHGAMCLLLAICLIWVTVMSYLTFANQGPNSAPGNKLQRVAKVSMLYGGTNDMYERALRSHERHGERWGYPMHVLRQDITAGFWNKPCYLLSLVINELAQPVEKRLEWFMWVDADSIILNNEIPMEIFLPPPDLQGIHLIATQDHNGLNTGIMFLHVHPWTINLLTETMAYPLYLPGIDLGRSADQEGMKRVLNKTTGGPNGRGYADGVVYLPRPWINAYEWDWAYEGRRGDLLVHFPGLEERRWPHMAKWLDIVEMTPHEWDLPLEETGYPDRTVTYWSLFRSARNSIESVEKKIHAGESMPARTVEAVEILRKVLREKSDNMDLIRKGLNTLGALVGKN
ncbi:unnamed protein product [Penicillium salamii]|uniref:Galactosyl transferase n=1 Tax=Penicillium salamii TaxID=1612424 RepID=A0A9W4NJK3_9EURO|nr:unnamed protein product [Penicillium salamii]CAG8375122.1 unnamed protein product [Penicillium salamii]CAG8375868.1 unnamed protein product [Penicillium salamii]CAG8415924.1 unnamed protein product [Penicillium salamii]